MLPRTQPFQSAGSGDTHAGLFEDIGTRSLQTVRVGEGAGKVSSGVGNAFVGYECGKQNAGGSYGTFVGYQAGAQNTVSSYSTMVGAFAGRQNLRGSEVVFIGYKAGELNKDGDRLVAIGPFALRENYSGTGSVAIGFRAAERTLDGDYNVVIGTESCQDLRSGNYNTSAGFRSGRAAFKGNENCYFGAFSGYSNSIGDGNCLVGYKAGENLAIGSYNVGVGAFTLQNAQNGSCNVAIGPFAGANMTASDGSVIIGNNASANSTLGNFNVVIGTNAGSSNEGDNNVLLGANVATKANVSSSVVIGANAADEVSGDASVYIGSGIASTIREGSSNVFIGHGADGYRYRVISGIAIGTSNTFTSTNSISIGDDIVNERTSSILLGYQLKSDANNSVVMGNDINIQSVIYWKDPLNFALTETVRADAITKLGISNITYGVSNQMLLSPSGEVYINAKVGLITSNLYNSFTLPNVGRVSPPTYDLRSIVSPCNYLIINGVSKPLRTNADAASIIALNDILTTLDTSIPSNDIAGVQAISNVNLNASSFLSRHTSNFPFHVPSACNAVIDILDVNATSTIAQLVVPKSAAFSHAVIQSSNIAYTQVVPSASYAPTVALPPPVFESTQGVTNIPNSDMRFTVIRPPALGKLNATSFQTSDNILYTPFHEAAFAQRDSFVVRPVLEIRDAAQNIFGCPSSNDVEISIDFAAPMTVFKRPSLTSVDLASIVLSSNILRTVPQQIPPTTPIRVLSMGSNLELNVNQTAYTSNEVANMVKDDIFMYPNGAFSQYLSAVRGNAQAIVASNQDVFMNAFGRFYTTTVPILTSALSNTIVSLSNVREETYITEDMLQATSNVVTFVSADAPIIVDLSNVSVSAVAVPTDLPLSYTTFSNVFANWVHTYDPNVTYTEISRILSSNISFEALYLNQLPFIYDTTVATYSASLATAVTSNELVVATNAMSNFMYNNLQTSNFDTFSNVLSNIDNVNTLVYKYFDATRLFLTYDDLINQRISLDVSSYAGSNDAITVEFGTPEDPINVTQFPISIIKETFWKQPPSSLPVVTIPRNKLLTSATLYDNSIYNADAVYVGLHPQNGHLSFAPDCNVIYAHTNPWMQDRDDARIVVQKGSETKGISIAVRYDPGHVAYEPTLLLPRVPRTTNFTNGYVTVSSISEEVTSLSNVTNYYTCNIDALGNSNTTENTVVTLLAPGQYNPAKGVLVADSNIFTSNVIQTTTYIDTFDEYGSNTNSNIRSNVFEFIYQTTYTEYQDGAYVYQSFTPSTSNFVEQLGCNVSVTSNIKLYTTTTIVNNYTRKSDVHISRKAFDQEHFFYFAMHDPAYYLYAEDTDVIPRNEANVETLSNIALSTRTTVSTFTSNLVVHSNISVFETLFPFTRHLVYHGASNTVYSLDISSSTGVDVVRSNVGQITQFTQQSLDDSKTWLRLKSASLSNALNITSPGVSGSSGPISINVDVVNVTSLSNINLGSVIISLGTQHEVADLSIWDDAVTAATLSFVPESIHIRSLQRGALHNSNKYGMTFDFASKSLVHYVATYPGFTTDTIEFYFSSNNQVFSPLFEAELHLERNPRLVELDVNMGLSYQTSNVLTPSIFAVARGPRTLANTKINVTSTDNAKLSKSSFTMAEVLAGSVFVSACNVNQPSGFTYNVVDASAPLPQLSTGHEFALRPYYHVAFPDEDVVNGATAINIEQFGYAPHVSNKLVGPLWSYISELNSPDAGRVSASNIKLYVTSSLSGGFLWNEQNDRSLQDTFTVQDFINNHIHYIPYASNLVPNETLKCRVLYQNNASPEYSISLKNYISRFPLYSIDPTIKYETARTVQIPPLLTRSQGLISDGYQWFPQNPLVVPQQFVAPLQTNTVVASLSNTVNASSLYQETFTLFPYTHSVPLSWQSADPLEVSIDQADHWNLAPILSRVSCNILEERDIVFYVNDEPKHGVILDKIARSNVVSFTDTDLNQQRIVYQHIGANTSNDSIVIGLSSTPYDLVTSELPINISVRSMPYVTMNKEQFIFHSTIPEAVSTIQRLGSNLHVEGSGFVHVLSSNVNITPTFSTAALSNNTIGYTIPSSYFETYGSNAPFPKLHMELAVNATSSPGYVNALAKDYAVYRPAFVMPYEANLNRYVNSNVITQPQERVQLLAYDIDRSLAASSNLKGRIVTYFLQVRPENDVFDENKLSSLQEFQTQHLRTFEFQVQMIDETDTLLVQMDFTQDTVAVSTQTTMQIIPIPSALRLEFNVWHNFLFVNEDPDNGKFASLYMDYDVTQSRIQNAERNILRGLPIQLGDLGVLKHIYLRTDMQSSSNYKGQATTFAKAATVNNGLGTMFELQNDRTTVQFRNQEVYITTYTLEETDTGIVSEIESLNHNVVIGKEITVRGTNNICVGNRFVTSGKNSIIVGNDIGSGISDVGTINDVYESIVIGNESFQNSIVRDVISIGNRNLNNLFLSPVDKVNDFLSQRPILIGNDIAQDRLDFNINIGNAFTKTIIGGQQIYLGLNGETVGIGYNSNNYLHDQHKVHVNGSVFAHGGIETPKVYGAKDIVNTFMRTDLYPNTSVGEAVVIQDFTDGVFTVHPTATPSNVGVFGVLESVGLSNCEVCVRGITHVKVKAPFEVGDLLVTSDTLGVCQRADTTQRHSYTFAKVLASSSNNNHVHLVPCQLL